MLRVKAEKPASKFYSGCSNKTRGWKGAILASTFSFAPQDRLLQNTQRPNSQIPRREPRASTPLTVCSSLTLGESLNISLPGFTRL